jgi:glutathione S-transferase
VANLRFYMTPGSCSTGIHILLEETGLVFEAYPLNLLAGDQFKPEYLAINPQGSVPTLVRQDGSALISYRSIACWLAESYPKARLLPEDEEGKVQHMAVLNHVLQTLHGEGFTRIFTTERYADNAAEAEKVKAQGRRIITRGFAALEPVLDGRPFVSGQFGIADSALFYVEFWADRTGIDMPGCCRRHYERVLQRPAVKQVMVEEGYASVYSTLA